MIWNYSNQSPAKPLLNKKSHILPTWKTKKWLPPSASSWSNVNYIKGYDHSGEKLFGEDSEHEYCQDFELPPEPRPEDKNTILANAYQIVLNMLKNSGIEKIYEDYMKILSRLG